ncbi:TauD/TfdA dioxygenase family protein [Chelatococcus reniformis]|uniref:Alpha-ketoglutarate-dependent 2,4-dichlorophenoxyacetate dioxygenase n=1 Tax=Chelatococcus reniformis TaxID=1494448 RepID=A0A916TWW6_9HYPH|nr:TauD/TfdA family dioxygenase [Chelatococcus reniformis]GGC48682.1 alpha-ketoglutarate-dependent 2,4-dichlorophenoxyacetate dioxygenase [Chelatococcus reniformis]
MTNTIRVQPLDATFGATVTGVKLAEIDDAQWSELYEAWLNYALLVFPEQHLGRDQQVAFARRFGDLEFDMAPISNVKADGTVRGDVDTDGVVKILKGNMGWHADSTYMPLQAKGAVFSAEIVPTTGGHTGFADMRAAYDALDDATRDRIEGLSAYHSLHYSQSKLDHKHKEGDEYGGYGFHDGPVPLRPLVKVHPETGRKSLLIGRHAHAIPGLDPAESEQLLADLITFACQEPRIYHHDWRPGDTVIWDNRCLLHRATPWNLAEPRVMWHSRIAGHPVSEAAVP